eukprot:CAMPEP_0173100002 /NCGR_PEP_ID=MMETSP1102-20130122/35904_1 /TAXON_ID=49646 /ORGANISM="Geminigera sp., Strain Caron Lab Isolate" /LENGTH=143 /DNA_ID=CAMNT_0013993281 /DNA_START=225 /DNA_END=653 /DNA_ORIENTATION=-
MCTFPRESRGLAGVAVLFASRFKQTRVGIVQGDIDALLRDLELDAGDLDRDSILPVDPTRVLCTVVVQTAARKQLVWACREGGADRYALELSGDRERYGSGNSSPKAAGVVSHAVPIQQQQQQAAHSSTQDAHSSTQHADRQL